MTTGRLLVRKIKNGEMKMSRNVIGLVAALLLAGTAFAAGANSGNLHLDKAVTVQGKELKSGEYRVRWNATGDNVQLNITDVKNGVTTVSARIVPVSEKNQHDGYVIRDQNGSSALTQIFFGGKNYELHLDEEAAMMTPSATSDSSNK